MIAAPGSREGRIEAFETRLFEIAPE